MMVFNRFSLSIILVFVPSVAARRRMLPTMISNDKSTNHQPSEESASEVVPAVLENDIIASQSGQVGESSDAISAGEELDAEDIAATISTAVSEEEAAAHKKLQEEASELLYFGNRHVYLGKGQFEQVYSESEAEQNGFFVVQEPLRSFFIVGPEMSVNEITHFSQVQLQRLEFYLEHGEEQERAREEFFRALNEDTVVGNKLKILFLEQLRLTIQEDSEYLKECLNSLTKPEDAFELDAAKELAKDTVDLANKLLAQLGYEESPLELDLKSNNIVESLTDQQWIKSIACTGLAERCMQELQGVRIE